MHSYQTMPPVDYDDHSVESRFHDYDDVSETLKYAQSDSSHGNSKSGSCGSLVSFESSLGSQEHIAEDMEDVDINGGRRHPIKMKIDISNLKKKPIKVKRSGGKMKRSGSGSSLGKMRRSGSGGSWSSAGKMKRSGSGGSIKEFLPIGSINEDLELRNEVFTFSSDEESSVGGDDFDSDAEEELDEVSASSSSLESSMGSSMGSEGVAIMDILKKSDSRDHIDGRGQRFVKSFDKKQCGDPLMDLYLRKARLTDKKTTKANQAVINTRRFKNTHHQDIESLLRKSDSKDHINNRGQRVVGSRRLNTPAVQDSLISKYLDKTKETSSEDASIEKSLMHSDSKNHIKGGKRVVHSYANNKSDDPLMARYLNTTKAGSSGDNKDHIKGRRKRVVRSRFSAIVNR